MAKEEFLTNIRIARNLFNHWRVGNGNAQSDPHALDQMLARSAIWLTPRSVRSFDAGDFPELAQTKIAICTRLSKSF